MTEHFKCGYCGAIYTHKAPVELCPNRAGLPHGMGKHYIPIQE